MVMVMTVVIVLRILDNGISSLLAEHHDRRDGEEAGDPWKCARIHYAQVVDATHAEAAVQNRQRIVTATDLRGARGMMSPGFVLDPLAELGVRVLVGAGKQLFFYGCSLTFELYPRAILIASTVASRSSPRLSVPSSK